MPKKSTFTGITSVPSNYFFDVFGGGFNSRISKPNLFAQIEKEIGTPGVVSLNDLPGALQLIAGTNMSLAINQAEGTLTFNSSLTPENMQSITFDTAAGATVTEGMMAWNDTDSTVDIGLSGGVVLQTGQEFVIKVRNETGITLVDGEAVYITGATGTRTVVERAQANTSAANLTIGVTTQTIENNSTGFVTIFGYVRDLDTSAWPEGDELWLSDSVAGEITNVKPDPPSHAVHIGFVVRSNANEGFIFVRIVNVESLEDIHDVDAASPQGGEGLVFDQANSTWVNVPVSYSIQSTESSFGTIRRSSEWTWFTATGDGLELYSSTAANSGIYGEAGSVTGIPVGAGTFLGTSTSSDASARLRTSLSFRLGFGPARFRTDVAVGALSDITETYAVAVGLHGGAFDTVSDDDEALFRYTDSVNSGNWVCASQDAGGGEEITNTAVSPTTGNTRQVLEIVVNADATETEFYIDGVLVATHTTVPTAPLRHGMVINKLAGTTQRLLRPLGAGWDYEFTDPI
jgi:hypothetical protein